MARPAHGPAVEPAQRDGRTVVIAVSKAFPPATAPESHRVLEWAAHLPRFGWRPIVLALSEDGLVASQRDASKLAAIPEGLEVRRVGLPMASERTPVVGHRAVPSWPARAAAARAVVARRRGVRWMRNQVLVPDAFAHWAPPAFAELRRIADARRVDAVLTTTPSTNHLVGWMAARRLGLPWVADFQGSWRVPPRAGPIRREISTWMGRHVVRRAAHVTAATPGLARSLRQLLDVPDPTVVPFAITIPEEASQPGEGVRARPDGRLRIVYAGRLYPERDPAPFLAAVDRLVARRPDLTSRLEVCFAGIARREVVGGIRRYADRPWLQLLPWLSLDETRRLQRDADVVLSIPGSFTASGRGRVVRYDAPGKTPELLLTGRPILALWSIQGDAFGILNEVGDVRLAPLHDVEAIERTIEDLLRHGPPTVAPAERRRRLARYAPEVLVGEMAAILDRVAGR